jgi:hypothetical protein
MRYNAISMEGDFVTGLNRVGIGGSSTSTVVASEVQIIYIFDLGEDSLSQSAWTELSG